MNDYTYFETNQELIEMYRGIIALLLEENKTLKEGKCNAKENKNINIQIDIK